MGQLYDIFDGVPEYIDMTMFEQLTQILQTVATELHQRLGFFTSSDKLMLFTSPIGIWQGENISFGLLQPSGKLLFIGCEQRHEVGETCNFTLSNKLHCRT